MKNSQFAITAAVLASLLLLLAAPPVLAGVEEATGEAAGAYDVTVVSNDIQQEIVIKVEINRVEVEEVDINGEIFSVVSVPGTNNMQPAGMPLVPSIGAMVQIGGTASVEGAYLANVTSRPITLNYPVLPCQEHEAGDTAEVSLVSAEVYGSLTPFPERQLFVREPEILRDVRFVQLGYMPVAYNPGRNTLMVNESAEIHLILGQNEPVNPLPEAQWRRTTAAWGEFYNALFINYENPTDGYDAFPEKYVIITPDDHIVDDLDEFVAWKEEQGFEMRVIPFSEVGADPDADDIWNYLHDIFNSPECFDRLILVGNEYHGPYFQSFDYSDFGSTYPRWFADDNHFGMLVGDDYIPDVWIGRFIASNANEMDDIIQKILYWEQTPNVEEDYYQTAMMACSGLYASQETTKERVRVYLQDWHDYQTVRTMYDWSWSSANTIEGWVSDGLSIINYRGEGWDEGWNPGHMYSFHVDNVHDIYNNDRLCIVTSIGCGVGIYDQDAECFGEAWVTLGTPSENRGAPAFIGPTSNTHTTFNNWLDRGIYYTMAKRDMTRLAEAFLYGKMYMRNWYWQPDYDDECDVAFREYLYFGNPDLQVRTELPHEPTLWYTFSNSSNKFWVYVEDRHGDKSPYAMVKLTAGDLVWFTQSDRDGVAEFPLPPSIPGRELEVFVNGFNFVPYSDTHRFESPGAQTVLITEVKPDIPCDGVNGDLVELYNYGDEPVELQNWILSDLDKVNVTFCPQPATLEPGEFAVICFQGSAGSDSVTPMGYGIYLTRRDTIDFSSLEDEVVLRNPVGHVIDSLAYHDGSGESTTNQAWDLTYLCGPSTPFEMRPTGWWSGDDVVQPSTYEDFAINWSIYAGNGGNGSIQRRYDAAHGFSSTDGVAGDSPLNFRVTLEDSFGDYTPPSTIGEQPQVRSAGKDYLLD